MGRPFKLSEKQCAEIERRLLAGEKQADLAREYGVDRSFMTRRFAKQLNNVRTVANQLVAADVALKSLPVAQQIQAVSLAEELKAISYHLSAAAKHGSMTAHRLSIVANEQVQKIDPNGDMDEQTIDSLKAVAAITRTANEAASCGLELLKANKEAVAALNAPAPQEIKKGLTHFYGGRSPKPQSRTV